MCAEGQGRSAAAELVHRPDHRLDRVGPRKRGRAPTERPAPPSSFDAHLPAATRRDARCRSCSAWQLVCFSLVHIAPGDPLVSILPPDASAELVEQMRRAYGFDQPLPVQYAIWLWRVAAPAISARRSPARGRSLGEITTAVGNTLMLAVVATHHRLRPRRPVRLRRRLFPRLLDRPRRVDAVDHRRQRAALLARHGAGHRLLGAADVAAGDGRGAGRLERRLDVGLGAHAVPGPAGRHDVA